MPEKYKTNWFRHEKFSQPTVAASITPSNCSDWFSGWTDCLAVFPPLNWPNWLWKLASCWDNSCCHPELPHAGNCIFTRKAAISHLIHINSTKWKRKSFLQPPQRALQLMPSLLPQHSQGSGWELPLVSIWLGAEVAIWNINKRSFTKPAGVTVWAWYKALQRNSSLD